MAKMGRPQIEIDWIEFEKLCAIHCTAIEIAGWFRCSVDTLERRCEEKYEKTFAEVFQEKKANGKISIRRTMFQKALQGNTTLLIWLSKNELGYSDKVDQKVSGNIETRGSRDAFFAKIFKDERSRELAFELAERMATPIEGEKPALSEDDDE